MNRFASDIPSAFDGVMPLPMTPRAVAAKRRMASVKAMGPFVLGAGLLIVGLLAAISGSVVAHVSADGSHALDAARHWGSVGNLLALVGFLAAFGNVIFAFKSRENAYLPIKLGQQSHFEAMLAELPEGASFSEALDAQGRRCTVAEYLAIQAHHHAWCEWNTLRKLFAQP